jgi:hypothetical protein
MNERDIAKKITQYLNFGANQLDRSVLERLQSARKQALAAHASPQHVLGLTMAGNGHSGHDGYGHGHASLKFWLSIAALLVGLVLALNWQEINSDASDDADATLLAEDLPVQAYLDTDFHAWLDQSSQF